jgi:hypothetical protein
MKRPPCIRNLPQFSEGCPRRPYDDLTGEGCPAWIEKNAPTTGEPLKKDMHRMCLDLWQFKMSWDLMGMIEGNLRATEMIRNALTIEVEGVLVPAPDPAMNEMVKMLKEAQKLKGAIEHEPE